MAEVHQLESILGMKGGDGEFSYAKNCSSQTNLLFSVKPMLEAAILSMKRLPKCKEFHVADLGCSSSHNSIIAVETVLHGARLKYTTESLTLPEFHVHFNDLPSNDFKALFGRLGPQFIYSKTHSKTSRKSSTNNYYSEVVGSFYKRLFPAASLHFVHSSCSLHWLSKIPDTVRGASSPAYNKWETFIAKHGSYEVAKAYQEQFHTDLTTFLKARAAEVVQGGVMFLVLPCRVASDPREQGSLLSLCGQLLTAAFKDLIKLGILEEEKLHSFNLPFYAPTMEEFKKGVRSEGSFSMESCQVLKGEAAGGGGGGGGGGEMGEEDRHLVGRHLSRQYRNGLERMIEAHIGADLTETLFQHVERRAVQMGHECFTFMERLTQLIVVLVRTP